MINLIITVLGGVVLIPGLISKALDKSPVPATLLALIVGVLLGPGVFGVIDPREMGNRSYIMESAARLILAVGLFSVTLRIPRDYPRNNWRQMLTLIGLSMILMRIISSLLVFFIIGVPFWLAALIRGIITPTDPVASSPIVTGSVADTNLPDRIRHAISFESGANDGLSYLFVFYRTC